MIWQKQLVLLDYAYKKGKNYSQILEIFNRFKDHAKTNKTSRFDDD